MLFGQNTVVKTVLVRWALVLGLLITCGAGSHPVAAQTNAPAWPAADPAAVAHWQSLRFGMFIHFGPVSLTGKEIGWSRGDETPIAVYDNLYKRFDPTNFNAATWVSIAKAAGMKYIVLTTKHHDGFCLWDTKYSDYNITHTPFKRDIVRELSDACRKQHIEFGAYYSTCDWWNTNFPVTSPGGTVKRETSNLDAYNEYLLHQVSELITNYGPLLTIWNDIPQYFKGRGYRTIQLVRALQPNILINNRTGDGGDYDTPEQYVGKYQDHRPWETCMTICTQWSWKPDDVMKSLDECITTLVRCAGGDGNLLFNVGPMPTGEIEPRQVARLQEIGAWMDRNGVSIYNTRGGPWKPGHGLASTRHGNTIYLHLLAPKGDTITLPALAVALTNATVLHGPQVAFAQKDGQLVLTVPAALRQPMDTIIQLDAADSVMSLAALEIPSSIHATASNVYHHDTAEYGAEFAFDGDPDTRWATNDGTKHAWVAVDLDRPQTAHGVRIQEAFAGRVQQFEFQCLAGSEWKTLIRGTTLGAHFEQQFDPVTAQRFRLNILDATEGPTIKEIELF